MWPLGELHQVGEARAARVAHIAAVRAFVGKLFAHGQQLAVPAIEVDQGCEAGNGPPGRIWRTRCAAWQGEVQGRQR